MKAPRVLMLVVLAGFLFLAGIFFQRMLLTPAGEKEAASGLPGRKENVTPPPPANRSRETVAGGAAPAREAGNAPVAGAGPNQAGKDAYQARWGRATALREQGRFDEAVPEYLWCYLNAGTSANPSAMRSLTRGQLANLAKTSPAAKAALQDLRDTVERQMQENTPNTPAFESRRQMAELAQLNQSLGDGDRMLQLYDSLPAGDPSRQAVATIAYNELVAKGRYADAVNAKSAAALTAEFDVLAQRPGNRESAVASAAQGIEALAGAGKLTEARALIDKVLAYSSSPETLAMLQTRLQRAGQPGLLAPRPGR